MKRASFQWRIDPRKHDQEQAIGRGARWALDLTSQDDELLA
jgi:hypothetical protein